MTARASAQALPPSTVRIEYVGPGKTAATVSISPAVVTLAGAETSDLAASAKDAASAALSDVLVQWSSSDTSVATVIQTGRSTGKATALGKRGSTMITAATPLGIAGRVQLDVVPRAAQLLVVSGGTQSGLAGTTLPQPLVVEVRATDGLPLAGVGVAFRATNGGGVAVATVVTDANGRASAQMTLGNVPGKQSFEASIAGVQPVVVTQTAVDPIPPPRVVTRMVKVSGDGQQATAGSSVGVAPAVMVTDDAGQPVAGAEIVFVIASGGGSATRQVTTADDAGIARVGSWTLGLVAGTNTLVATSGAVSTTFSATGTVGALSTVRVVSAPDTLVVGTAADFIFGIVDANGNAVAQQGAVLSLSYSTPAAYPNGGGGPLTTDAQGRASFFISPVMMPAGLATFVLTAPGMAPFTFGIPVVAGAPAWLFQVGGAPLYAMSGTRFSRPPTAQAVDIAFNPTNTPGVVVTASLAAGNGTLGGTTSVATDAHGAAVFSNLTVTGVEGNYTLLLSTPSIRSSGPIPFTVYAGASAAMAISAGNNQSAAAGSAVAVAPSVRVTDASGNPIFGREITFAVGAGGGQVTYGGITASSVKIPTDGLGIAQLTRWTLGAAGANTVVVTADTTLSGSPATITATALPPATRLQFVTPPPSSVTSAVRMAQQPRVALMDANGAAMTTAGVTITASVTSGIGNVRNATAVTDASGIATFTDLTLSGTAGAFALAFTSPGYATLDFQPIAVSAFSGSVSIVAGNNQSAIAGTNVAIAPSVLVKDAAGAPAAGVLVLFVVDIFQGQISAGGPSTTNSVLVMSDAQGIARLTSWTMGTTAGAPNGFHALVYSTLGGHVTFTGTSVPGPAATLRLGTMPTSGTGGVPFNPAPVVHVADRYGNLTPQSNVPVSALPHQGSVSNATVQTDANGVATFSALTLSALVGNNVLVFSAPGMPSVDSPPINMRAGPPFFLRIAAGAGQTATAGTPVLVAPSARIEDYAGNGLSGITIAFDGITSGATMETASGIQQPALLTSDASGVVSLRAWTLSPTPGTNTIVASVPSLPLLPSGPITFNATGLAPSGNVLAVTSGPSTATTGVVMATPLVVQLRNGSGAPIAQAGVPITAAIVGSSGVLSGTVTVTTNAAGVATFTNLVLTGPTGSYSIRLSSPGVAPATVQITM